MNNSTLHLARSYARTHAHAAVSPAHLLRALLHNDLGLAAELGARGKDPEYLRDWADLRLEALPRAARPLDEPPLDNRARVVLEAADLVRLKLSLPETGPWCVLAALCRPGAGFSADQLRSLPLTENEVLGFMLQEQQQPSGSSASPAPDVTPAAGTLKPCTASAPPNTASPPKTGSTPSWGGNAKCARCWKSWGAAPNPTS